jgi:hypothetical protein
MIAQQFGQMTVSSSPTGQSFHVGRAISEQGAIAAICPAIGKANAKGNAKRNAKRKSSGRQISDT